MPGATTSSSSGADATSSPGSTDPTHAPSSDEASADTSADNGSEVSTEPSSDGPAPVVFDVATPELDLGTIRPSACPCAENTERIQVVTTAGEIWGFDPTTLDFELVVDLFGLPGCATPQIFSMALDRGGLAWLQFADGTLHTIDINSPTACDNTGFVTPPALGITNFGMGFVSESIDNPCDALFGHRASGFADGPGVGLLFEVDTEALAVVDSYPTDFAQSELTGTGDARLFGFAGSAPAKLVEFDKHDGSTIDQLDLDGLELTSAFAFSAYAGDFYFFTVSDDDFTRSEVNHIDYDDSDGNGQQDLTEIVAAVPFVGTISGAGVSTCAPSEPPPS